MESLQSPKWVKFSYLTIQNIYVVYNLNLIFSLKFRLSFCGISFLLFCNKGPFKSGQSSFKCEFTKMQRLKALSFRCSSFCCPSLYDFPQLIFSLQKMLICGMHHTLNSSDTTCTTQWGKIISPIMVVEFHLIPLQRNAWHYLLGKNHGCCRF